MSIGERRTNDLTGLLMTLAMERVRREPWRTAAPRRETLSGEWEDLRLGDPERLRLRV